MKINDIKNPAFLKTMKVKELDILCADVRTFLTENIAKTGGHLSSNLGAVELTIAMHKVFDSPKDQLIFDVGHQGYTHKILTGRADRFDTLRQTDGLSGFLKRAESEHDVFEAGHSSTSLAAGAGMLFAREMDPDIGHVVMLIGDGALTSGAALEALNFMGHDESKNPIIILNDNEMSISKNVGHLSKMLTKIRMRKTVRGLRRKTIKIIPKFMRKVTFKVEKRLKGFISGQTYFEDIGYDYYGPLDGHDMKTLIKVFEVAKQTRKPCVIHLRTQKGRGYVPSEKDETGRWHGVGAFDIRSGDFVKEAQDDIVGYSRVVSKYLMWRAAIDDRFYVITPAMIGGSDLHDFQAQFRHRLIDVGIAEQTAVTMATGLALKHVKVFLSIYSTFLQRAYDQVIHDLARHNVHVVIGIDRAGIVGGDGDTHQGIYDIPMLSHIPNMTIAHPKDPQELFGIMNYAFDVHQGPIAIRYAREDAFLKEDDSFDVTAIAPSWSCVRRGSKGTIITFGTMVGILEHRLKDEKLDVALINARYIKPLDHEILNTIDWQKPVMVVEESTLTGGLGSMILNYLADTGTTHAAFKRKGFSEAFVEHGDKSIILKRYGLDADSILVSMKALINET